MRWLNLLRILVVLLLLAAVGVGVWTQRHRWQHTDSPKPSTQNAPDPVEISSVKLSDEAVRSLGLRSEESRLEDYPKVIEVPGVITDAPGRSRAVAVPVAGIVSKVHIAPREAVRAGDPLFTIQLASDAAQSTQTDLARAAASLIVATAQRDQTAKLVAAGTKRGQDLIDDEKQVQQLTTQIEGYRRQLLLFGFTSTQVKKAESGGSVTEIVLTVPAANAPTEQVGVNTPSDSLAFAFEVESIAVAQGEGVISGQLLARLADYRELAVEGQAFETEAALITDATGEGRPIGVDFLEPIQGRVPIETKLIIRSVGKTDPATRTFRFFAALANEGKPYERDGKTYLSWRYRPGRQVRLRIPTDIIPKVIVLPTDAVVREGPDAFVFRQNGDVFIRKAVAIVAEDRLNVAIAPGNGIEAGVYVLRNNAAAVNRALKAMQARGVGGAGGKKGHWHADGTFHEEKD